MLPRTEGGQFSVDLGTYSSLFCHVKKRDQGGVQGFISETCFRKTLTMLHLEILSKGWSTLKSKVSNSPKDLPRKERLGALPFFKGRSYFKCFSVSVQKERIMTQGLKVVTQIPRGRLKMTGLKEGALTPSRNPHLDRGTGVTREGPEFGVRIEKSKCRVHGGGNS